MLTSAEESRNDKEAERGDEGEQSTRSHSGNGQREIDHPEPVRVAGTKSASRLTEPAVDACHNWHHSEHSQRHHRMDHAHDYAELIIHQWQWPVDQAGTAQQPVQNAIIAQQQHPGKRLDEIAGPEGNEHQQKHLVSTVFFQAREPISKRIS